MGRKKLNPPNDIISFRMNRDIKFAFQAYCEKHGLRVGKTLEILILKLIENSQIVK